jgi:D-alanine-D-alanine ligase
VQEFLSGTEYGVGVIGNPRRDLIVLPPLEVDYDGLDPSLPRLLGFESKAMPHSPYWSQIRFREARLDARTRAEIEAASTAMFERLGLRDYGRFDFRADAHGKIKFIECNPNPAWANDGKLAYMAGFAGIQYADMLRMILEAAQARAASERGIA